MKLANLQPSQLYISSHKLATVLAQTSERGLKHMPPIPVKEMDGRIVMLDGHTRAVALYMLGFDEATVYWEPEEWDWEAYRICVEWCVSEGITAPSHLVRRVVFPEDYCLLWLKRCEDMHAALARRAGHGGASKQ